MARADPVVSYTSSLTALRRMLSVSLLALLPVVLAAAVIGGAIGNHFAFDFHGSLWEASRAILHGRNPYPPPTVAGVAPGDRFAYPPVIAVLLVPLGVLPFPLAAALMTLALLAAVGGVLWLLGVRDWRCYGAAYLAIPVLHDVRLGALTPLLALGVALTWRWRDRPRAALPLALIVLAKLFLWPLGVWMIASGRTRIAWRTVLYCVLATLLSWALIDFHGLTDYPQLLQVLSSSEQARGYSPVAAGLALGMGSSVARAVAVLFGLVLLGLCVALARRGHDRGSLIVALAASLALSPIVWLHYFVLLLVPIALVERRFGWLWLTPLLFWITPFEENLGAHWRIAAGIAIAGFALVACTRRALPGPGYPAATPVRVTAGARAVPPAFVATICTAIRRPRSTARGV